MTIIKELSTTEILAILSMIATIISIIVAYLNHKATLKQSEKNLLIQLSYNDTKKAQQDLLDRITKNHKYNDLKYSVKSFLDSAEGQFLPENLKKQLKESLEKLESFCYQDSPYPKHQLSSDEEMKSYAKDEEEYMKAEEERKKKLTPDEKFEEEFAEKFSEFRERMIKLILSNLENPEKGFNMKKLKK